MSLPTSTRVGRYLLVRRLGRGGQASVYEAHCEAPGAALPQRVALKLLHAGALANPEAWARLRREAELLRRIEHPGVVRLLEAGLADGVPFLAYELVEGAIPLDEAFRANGRVDVRVRLVRDAARAAGALHAQGIVHRDLSPDNVLVDAQGRVKLVDLGLAHDPRGSRLTRTGEVLGTVGWVAPEVGLDGSRDRTSPAADVWALGLLLYQALTGRHPFPETSLAALLERLARGEVPGPAAVAPATPPALDALCRQALAADPARRPADGESFARALDAAWTIPPSARFRLPPPTTADGRTTPGTVRLRRLQDGARLGRWTLLRTLGAGGMGQVFLARDERLGRELALKLLEPSASDQRRQRFLREAAAAARVRHPALVAVHEAGEDEGWAWLAMDPIQGRSLDQVLERGPLPAREAARLTADMARALAALHAAGVLHRDVKPGNVLLDEQGRARLCDFGVALLEGEDRLTRTGAGVGSPVYMAPEALEGQADLDARVDVYGLGCLLHEALAGEPPFLGAALPVLAQAKREGAPRLPSGIDRSLAAICRRSLEPSREARWTSAEELAAALEAWLEGRPVSGLTRHRLSRGARRALAGATALALALVGWLATGGRRAPTDRAQELAAARRDLERRGLASSRLAALELSPELLETAALASALVGNPKASPARGAGVALEEDARRLLIWVALLHLARGDEVAGRAAAERAGQRVGPSSELLQGALLAGHQPAAALDALRRAEGARLAPLELHRWRLLALETRGVPDRVTAEEGLAALEAAERAGLALEAPERLLRAVDLLALGRGPQAAAVLEGLDPAAGPPALAWELTLLRCEADLEAARGDQAVQRVRAATVPTGPPTPRAARLIARALREIEALLAVFGRVNAPGAAEQLTGWLELHAALRGPPLSAGIRDMVLASILARAAAWDRAPGLYLAALRCWPLDPAVLGVLADMVSPGEALDQGEAWRAAREQLLVGVRFGLVICPPPARHRCRVRLVRGLVQLGQPAEAVGLARAGLAGLSAWEAAGELSAAEAEGQRGELLRDLAAAERQLGFPAEALELLERAERLPVASSETRDQVTLERLRSLVALGRVDDACRLVADWTRQGGPTNLNGFRLHETAWWCVHDARRWDVARPLAELGVSQGLNDVWVLRLALVLAEQGEPEAALSTLRAASSRSWARVDATVLPRHPDPDKLAGLERGDPAALEELRAIQAAAREVERRIRR